MDQNYNKLLDEIDAFISKLAEKPDILLMNNMMLTKVRAAARRAGFYERDVDGLGRVVETYNGIPMMDCKEYHDGKKSIEVIETTTPTETEYGTTAIYAVKIALNGFHGISVDGEKMLKTYLLLFYEFYHIYYTLITRKIQFYFVYFFIYLAKLIL